jgi:hypothetical protein|tara:strand:- start:277 stop:423 length:147 start_codon:yes stop_codon:yes gene_type:complete
LDTIALVAGDGGGGDGGGDGDGGGEHTEVSSAKAAGEVLHKLASHTSS